ncbi:MAG: hypothetical protein IH591_15500, partial [Bacteroidales bacterium]|nr:hypothetical protein [Bacteroidales bacterium]
MRKILTILAWLIGGLGGLMMFTGAIAVLAGGILWDHYWSSYFFPGCGFVVLAIFIFLGISVSFASLRNTSLLIAMLIVLTTFTPGCKTKDLQEQILALNEVQASLTSEKDSLLKVLSINNQTITALQSDTLKLSEEIDNLLQRNKSLSATSAKRAAQINSAEQANTELQARADEEAARNAALQAELNSMQQRIAAIDRDLSASAAEKERLAAEIQRQEEQRIADSIAEANRPVVVPVKTSGWYVNTTEIGWAAGLGETSPDYTKYCFGFTNVFGYSFSKNINAGIGTGVHFYNGGTMIPPYLDFRYIFAGDRFNPFIVADG